jgi:hypothetical protein
MPTGTCKQFRTRAWPNFYTNGRRQMFKKLYVLRERKKERKKGRNVRATISAGPGWIYKPGSNNRRTTKNPLEVHKHFPAWGTPSELP